jgi:hypothetical protein
MTTIDLQKECGAFCTERTHPRLPWLRDQIKHAIETNQSLNIDRSKVKIFTVSFLDEMTSELAVQFGLPIIQKVITFSPPLEPFYVEQMERGVRLRKSR